MTPVNQATMENLFCSGGWLQKLLYLTRLLTVEVIKRILFWWFLLHIVHPSLNDSLSFEVFPVEMLYYSLSHLCLLWVLFLYKIQGDYLKSAKQHWNTTENLEVWLYSLTKLVFLNKQCFFVLASWSAYQRWPSGGSSQLVLTKRLKFHFMAHPGMSVMAAVCLPKHLCSCSAEHMR